MSEPAIIDWIPKDLLSDEPPLESDLHRDQIELLIRTLKLWWQEDKISTLLVTSRFTTAPGKKNQNIFAAQISL